MKRNEVVKTINALKGEEGHQKVLEVYNAQKPLPRGYKLQYKDPWCAATISAVFLMNEYNALSEVSCTMMTKKAKDLGIWVEDDAYVPQIGDVIMYDWQDSGKGDNLGTPDHVGIVISVTKSKIMVREGNKNKTLGNRDVTVNSVTIRGYITPPYEDDTGIKDDEIVSAPKKENTSYYAAGNTYTIKVRSALNVRSGAGKNYGLVGYNNLTPDGKKHAVGSALKNGTKVTCIDVEINSEGETWIRIPSGWVCAISGNNTYVV